MREGSGFDGDGAPVDQRFDRSRPAPQHQRQRRPGAAAFEVAADDTLDFLSKRAGPCLDAAGVPGGMGGKLARRLGEPGIGGQGDVQLETTTGAILRGYRWLSHASVLEK